MTEETTTSLCLLWKTWHDQESSHSHRRLTLSSRMSRNPMSRTPDRTSNYGTYNFVCSVILANELIENVIFFPSKLYVFCSHITFCFLSRYVLRATIGRRLSNITKELDIVVHTLSTYPEINSSIKMEVGIEDCLHIEFEYNKSKYVFSSL